MNPCKTVVTHLLLALLIALTIAAALPAQEAGWVRVIEDDRAIKIETDKLEAVIPKKKPRPWMTGIEKGSFLDKATGGTRGEWCSRSAR